MPSRALAVCAVIALAPGSLSLAEARPRPAPPPAPWPGLPCQDQEPSACPVAHPRQRTLRVREEPRRGASSIGEVRADGSVTLRAVEAGSGGCPRWLRVHPVGYVCADEVLEGPPVRKDRPPARYAVVQTPEAPVRDARSGAPAGVLHRGDGVTIVGEVERPLLRAASKQLVRRADLSVATPSSLRGQNLRALPDADRLRLAFVVPPRGAASALLHPAAALLAVGEAAKVSADPAAASRPAPSLGLPEATSLPRYAAVFRTDQRATQGRVAVRLADGKTGEIDADALRAVTPADPPADLSPDERWIDVSLGQQVAVAYQGRAPVFATLVSTAKHGTPTGTWYIQRKHRTQTMQNRAESNARYDFRDVPAAQFYDGRFGLHAALWHDRLGEPVSHGCVNLSPADAEHLFAFTEPPLPAGWQTIKGIAKDAGHGQHGLPASRVVIRP